MTFSPRYDIPRKYLYNNQQYYLLCDHFNGTVDLYQALTKSYVGESVYVGVERAVERDELVEV